MRVRMFCPQDLAMMVRGLVCIQSPFGGSPIATDIVFGPRFVRDAVKMGLTAVLGGTFACIDDLTVSTALVFYSFLRFLCCAVCMDVTAVRRDISLLTGLQRENLLLS